MNRPSSLFREVLSLFQKKDYHSAFYLSVVLGEMGFAEGYTSAGFLIESELVETSHICVQEK